MKNYVDGFDMPLGFGMALGKNIEAMNYFTELSKERQKQIIEGTHTVKSKEEMAEYVNSIIFKG